MAEVLVHPWLDNVTPGITYVPAPSVAELAKPRASARHIDRDLFQSLCVIWGRHADYDQIKADLLSPAGDGTLAKAFYFLLQKHRQRTMEEHGILMDDILKSPGKVVIKQYSTPKYRKGESEIIPRPEFLFPASSTISESGTASSSTPARPPITIPTIPAIERPVSREHPPSPAGPRPQRPRPTSSPVGDNPLLSHQDGRLRMHSGPKGSFKESSPTPARPSQLSEMLATLPHQTQSLSGHRYPGYTGTSRPPPARPPRSAYRQRTGTAENIHAPVPVPALQPKILPMITAPKVADAELQKTIDHYASVVNEQAQSWNTAQNQLNAAVAAADSVASHDSHVRGRSSRSTAQSEAAPARDSHTQDDKENVENAGQHGQTQGGLGFGSSVPMAHAPMSKEMSNLLALTSPEKKDKKHRRKQFR